MVSPALASVLALPLADKIARLIRIAPVEDVQGIELLVDFCLKRCWPGTQWTVVQPHERKALRQ